jgi:hypothetical protein
MTDEPKKDPILSRVLRSKTIETVHNVRIEEDQPKKKNPAAVSLGRRGGKAWARSLTPEQMREAMRRAARIRWERYRAAKDPPG